MPKKSSSKIEFELSFYCACLCILILPTMFGFASDYSEATKLFLLAVSWSAPVLGFPVFVDKVAKDPKPSYLVVGLLTIGIFNSYTIVGLGVYDNSFTFISLLNQLLRLWGLLLTMYILISRGKKNGEYSFMASHAFLGGMNILVLVNIIAYFFLGIEGKVVEGLQESLGLSAILGGSFERVQFPSFGGLNSLGVFGAILYGAGLAMSISGFKAKKTSWNQWGKINSIGAFSLGIICILLSDTRSAYGYILLGPILIWMLRTLSLNSGRLFSLLAFAIFPLISPIILVISNVFLSSYARYDTGFVSGRDIIWFECTRIIQSSSLEQIIFGRGPTLSLDSRIVQSLFRDWASSVISCHNTLINQMYTLGILGILFWLFLSYLASVQMNKLARSRRYCYCASMLSTIFIISSVESFNSPSNMTVNFPFIWSVFTMISLVSEKDLDQDEDTSLSEEVIVEGMINRLARR
jgi:hypothetical protein